MFGRELKNIREAAGMSQEQLAFEAGVHRTYISLLERDKKSPTLNVLLRICKALDVSAADLVNRVEKAIENHRGSLPHQAQSGAGLDSVEDGQAKH